LTRVIFLAIKYMYRYIQGLHVQSAQYANLSFYIALCDMAMEEMQLGALRRRIWSFSFRYTGGFMKRNVGSFRANAKLAGQLWGKLTHITLSGLRELTVRHGLSVAAGDLQLLDGRWYVTHSGLLQLASRRGCRGIKTIVQNRFSDFTAGRWVFKAIVYKSGFSKGFVGYGDADPSNSSSLVRGAEMRVAETRAVNRALRKAYGVGLCSVEELGSFSAPREPFAATPPSNGHPGSNGSSNGQPRLRDKLCLLIRKYELDPNLVKRYAADFCGTESLRDAGRDLVEAFVSTVGEEAASDRAALVCKLNSYQPQEVKS
jgi:hypothetical protein